MYNARVSGHDDAEYAPIVHPGCSYPLQLIQNNRPNQVRVVNHH
jgi:hypothetical protein